MITGNQRFLRDCRPQLASAMLLFSAVTSAMGFDLQMAFVVFRHGDRTPAFSIPNGTCDANCWHYGPGQLTDVGMHQLFTFGTVLQKRYKDLVSKTYVRDQVYVRSTGKERAVMSAQALLSALYWPVEDQKIKETPPWHSFHVDKVPFHNDSLLYSMNSCPRFTQLYDALPQTEKYKAQEKKYTFFMKWVQQMSGVDYMVTILTAHHIADVVRCQNVHEKIQPQWVNASVLNNLEELSGVRFKLMFEGREAHRLSSGLLINNISNLMTVKANGDNSTAARLFLYSAHQATVAAFLSGLGIFNGLQPPYGAGVLVELYSKQLSEDKQEHYFQVLYRNITARVDSTLVDLTAGITGCMGTSPCHLSVFQSIAADLKIDDWQSACQLLSNSSLQNLDENHCGGSVCQPSQHTA